MQSLKGKSLGKENKKFSAASGLLASGGVE